MKAKARTTIEQYRADVLLAKVVTYGLFAVAGLCLVAILYLEVRT